MLNICQLCMKTQRQRFTKFLQSHKKCAIFWGSLGTFFLGDKKPLMPKLVTVLFQIIDIFNHLNIILEIWCRKSVHKAA